MENNESQQVEKRKMWESFVMYGMVFLVIGNVFLAFLTGDISRLIIVPLWVVIFFSMYNKGKIEPE